MTATILIIGEINKAVPAHAMNALLLELGGLCGDAIKYRDELDGPPQVIVNKQVAVQQVAPDA